MYESVGPLVTIELKLLNSVFFIKFQLDNGLKRESMTVLATSKQ